MTSIPASRSARAMIFAPRSCPSRPGFATTTRIFFSEEAATGPRSLERGRFPVRAEHLLKRLHHLSLGGIRSGRLEQVGHQVLARVTCRPLEPLERGIRGPALAPLSD